MIARHPALQPRSAAPAARRQRRRAHARRIPRRGTATRDAFTRALHRADGHVRSGRPPKRAMLALPARFFVDFFERHGFLNVNDRPAVAAPFAAARASTRASSPRRYRAAHPPAHARCTSVKRTRRRRDGPHRDAATSSASTTCSSPATATRRCACSTTPTPQETEILGAFPYQANEVVLHTDDAHVAAHAARARRVELPRARARQRERDRVALTYDMNMLQTLDAPGAGSWSRSTARADIDPAHVLHTVTYASSGLHAGGRRRAEAARARSAARNRTFYCGAYWRYGFHEDGVVSAEWAVEDFSVVAARERAARIRPRWRAVG